MTTPPPLIDFHCHLSRSGGISALGNAALPTLHGDEEPRVVAVTNTVSEWRALAGTGPDDRIAWGLGLHPGERHSSAELADFAAALQEADLVGEIGLDFGRDTRVPKKQQRDNLDAVLNDLDGAAKVISVHSVGARRDIVEALAGRSLPGTILHWYIADENLIDRAIDLDVFFSVNPAMLHSARGRDAVLLMPPNRVLLETDAPFGLTGRNEVVNIAAAITTLLDSLGRLWHVDAAETRRRIVMNQDALLARAPIAKWKARRSR